MKLVAGLITFLIPAVIYAECNLEKDTGMKQEDITMMIMNCNVKLLEGEKYLIDNQYA